MIPDNIGDFGKSLSNDEARMKLLGAEMTLANIRALCEGAQYVNASGLRGIIDAIRNVSDRTMDTEVRTACEAFGRIQSLKDQFRALAQDLLALTDPEQNEEVTGDETREERPAVSEVQNPDAGSSVSGEHS